MFYFFQEKYDKVIKDFTSYIRLVPDKPHAYRILSMAYLKIGKYNKAISSFSNSREITPEEADAVCYRAEAFRNLTLVQPSTGDSMLRFQIIYSLRKI